MTSLSSSFQPSSLSSLRDVVASYRRAQYLVAASTVSSRSYEDEEWDETQSQISDVEEQAEREEEVAYEESQNLGVERVHEQDEFVSQMDWDDIDETSSARLSPPSRVPPVIHISRPVGLPRSPDERTPLIARKVSFPTETRPIVRRQSSTEISHEIRQPKVAITRRLSNKSLKAHHHGGSTYGQSLFNSIAILLGIGMLSEPLAFSYAGWICGTLLIFLYGALTCYTAKILAKIILEDPRLRSYSDIGRKAFGPRSTFFISVMFCLELFAVSVVLVTLYGDSFYSIAPRFESNTYKLMGLLVFIPTVYLPLSLLSYTSILGILSTILIVIVVLVDGMSKKTAPGSFWEPAPTSIGVGNVNQLALSFGLFMAGFSGHAVIPSIARDMVDPSQFDHMINWAFAIATCIYALIGVAGYIMFGDAVTDEISRDLINTPGFNRPLNKLALVLLVIMPLTKFALTTQPMNTTIQILLGLEHHIANPEEVANRPNKLLSPLHSRKNVIRVLSVMQRAVMTCASVAVSIAVPEFSAMMAFLGSFSAFMLCVIGPLCAKIAMTRRCSLIDGAILLLAIVSAVWGTVAAVIVD